jgi:hypothetical protein
MKGCAHCGGKFGLIRRRTLPPSVSGESGATRTPFPARGGQQSGDCGQRVMAG